MMKKLYILFFIILNLYSSNVEFWNNNYYCQLAVGPLKNTNNPNLCGITNCSDTVSGYICHFYLNGYEYLNNTKNTIGGMNEDLTCLKDQYSLYGTKICNDFYKCNSGIMDYCKKKSGYVYSTFLHVWINNDTGTKICNSNTFHNVNDDCSNTCPSGNIYFYYNGQNYCLPQDTNYLADVFGDDFFRQCHFENVERSMSVVDNSNNSLIYDKAHVLLVCPGGIKKIFNVTNTDISLASKDTSDLNLTKPTDINCSGNEDVLIDNSGNVVCIPQNSESNSTSHSSNESNNSNTDSNSNVNGNNSVNDINSSNGNVNSGSDNVGSDSNSTNSKDCCDYYNHPVQGDSWEQKGDKWCSLKYKCCITKDKEGNCHDYTSNSNDSNGTNIDLTGIENRIDTTNNILKDIYNLKPDSNNSSDVDELYINTNSVLSNITDFINNYKSTFNNLKDSLNKTLEIVKNPKEITFDSSLTSCPIIIHVYNSDLDVDICKFISPYKPLLQLFFTIIFSLSVIFYFFDVFIRTKEV